MSKNNLTEGKNGAENGGEGDDLLLKNIGIKNILEHLRIKERKD